MKLRIAKKVLKGKFDLTRYGTRQKYRPRYYGRGTFIRAWRRAPEYAREVVSVIVTVRNKTFAEMNCHEQFLMRKWLT